MAYLIDLTCTGIFEAISLERSPLHLRGTGWLLEVTDQLNFQ
jgi:hypothetical protein